MGAHMDRCLQIPEILRLICDQIPSNTRAGRHRLFITALSCRAFLEPALDSLWHSIHGLEPIIACLPEDLLKSETRADRNPVSKYTVLSLARVVTSADLQKYLTHYAPRIRKVSADGLVKIFSVDLWQGLQLATRFERGALAPFNTELGWYLIEHGCWAVAPALLAQSYPYFSLFLGHKTTCLNFGITATVPIHLASVENALSGPSNVKKLHISNFRLGRNLTVVPYIGQLLTPQHWMHLEDLKVSTVPNDCLPALSSLPRLAHLAISVLLNVQALNYGDDDLVVHNHIANLPAATSFPSLQSLKILSDEVVHLSGVLQLVSPRSPIHSLECNLTSPPATESEIRELDNLMLTIQHHCNPDTLRELVVCELVETTELAEANDLDDEARLKLKPILPFAELTTVHLGLSHQVSLRPDDIEDIVSSWPNLEKLNIDVDVPSSRVPSIGHTELLNLVYSCRKLKELGLRINTTQIRHAEPRLDSARYDAPAPLTKLWVGDSPIISPRKVSNFLATHCPKLLANGLQYFTEYDVPDGAPWFKKIYGDRWQTVGSRMT